MTQGIYLTADLFLSSGILSVAREHGCQVQLARSLPQAAGDAGVQFVVLDLACPGVTPQDVVAWADRCSPRPHVLAYGQHVNAAALDSARAAGCDAVLTQGQFHQQAGAIFQKLGDA